MASRRELRRLETDYTVMRLIHERPSISTREIAKLVGISNGSAHYCVTALIEIGFVKLKKFRKSQTKSQYLYELTPRGLSVKAAFALKFLNLKRKEYDVLKAEIERMEYELNLQNKNKLRANKGSI